MATTPYLTTFATDAALYAYLARLNEDGHHPEMPAMDDRGRAFLATLTEPDADHVHHVVTDHDGHAHQCDEWCPTSQFVPCTWRPTYPVTTLSEQDPAIVLDLIAREARAEDARHAARVTGP